MIDYAPPTELVLDHVGILTVSDGIVYYLTECCHASAKGGQHGVVCRACYSPIPDAMGAAWMVDDAPAWNYWAAAWHAAEDGSGPQNAAVIDRLIARVLDRAAGK